MTFSNNSNTFGPVKDCLSIANRTPEQDVYGLAPVTFLDLEPDCNRRR